MILNPDDPTHKGAEWIQDLEVYYRGSAANDAQAGGPGLGGFQGYRLALRRRTTPTGIGWLGVGKALLQWHVASRFNVIFSAENGQVYTAVETLDVEGLSLTCEMLGTDAEDVEWVDNRRGLLDFLVKEQQKEIDVELSSLPPLPAPEPPPPFIEAPPSHPRGMGPLASTVGNYRTHFPLMPRLAVEPTKLPPSTVAAIGMSVLHCCSVSNATPLLSGWLGLSDVEQDVMVSGLIGGVLPGVRPTGPIILEGLETVQPHRHISFTQAQWDRIIPVSSPAEAWAVYDENPDLEWYSWHNGAATITLDDPNSWAGFAVGRDGKSIISSPSTVLGAKPNFTELLKALGVTNDTSILEERRKIAEGLAQASADAAFNAMVSAKAAGHALFDAPKRKILPIQSEVVDPQKNPLLGTFFPALATSSEKLALVLQSSQQPSDELCDCDTHWWCLMCNARSILQLCAKTGLFSLDDLRSGKFQLTKEIKQEIICLEPGVFRCNKHQLIGKKYRGLANPPTGVKFLCVGKNCHQFIQTSSNQITHCCSNCGLDYSGCDSNDAIEVELNKARGLTAEVKEIDELCYAYLTGVQGEKVIEANKQRIVSTPAQARLAINFLRSAPTSITGRYARLRSPLTARKVCWGPLGRFRKNGDGGLWLWDFLPKTVQAQPSLTLDQLNTIVKLCEKGGGGEFANPTSSMKLPKISETELCAEFTSLCITSFEIALEQIMVFTNTGYAIDIAVSVELARNEFQSQFKQYPPAVVFAMLNAFLEDTSLRLERSASAPQVDHLTYYERTNGGSIRWIFNPACAGVLQHVAVLRERQLDSLGWAKSDTLFDVGDGPAPAKKEENKKSKKKKQKKKKEEAKAAEQSEAPAAAKNSLKPEEKANSPKGKGADGKGSSDSPKDGSVRPKGKGAGRGKGSPAAKGRGKGAGKSRGASLSGGELPDANPPLEENETEQESREEDLADADEDLYESGRCEKVEHRKPAQINRATPSSGATLKPRPGELHGDGAVAWLEKLKVSFPRVISDNKIGEESIEEVCPHFNSVTGCHHPACSRRHVKLSSDCFSPAWHMWLLVQGGHHESAHRLTEEGICRLLSPDQAIQVMSLNSQGARRDLLLRHLSNRLTNLMHANSEPLGTLPVTQGREEVHRVELWPAEGGPFELASPSGMGPCAYGRAVVGSQDAVWQGLTINTGHSIDLFQNFCPIKAVASIMPTPKRTAANRPDLSPDLLLLKSVVKNALQLNWRALDHRSVASFRLICFARALKDFKGWLIDSVWSVLHQDCSSPFHILQICTGLEGQPITYRLNTVHAKIATKGELQFSPTLAHQMLNRDWSSDALKAPVVAVLVSRPTKDTASRHSEGFLLGKGHSLGMVHRKLMQMVQQGHKVIYSEQNGAMKLNKDIRKSSIRREDLQEAEKTLKWAASQLGLTMAEWAPEPTSGRKTIPFRYGSSLDHQAQDWELLRNLGASQGSPSENTVTEEDHRNSSLALTLEDLPVYKEEWRKWHFSQRGSQQLKGKNGPHFLFNITFLCWTKNLNFISPRPTEP